LSSILDIDLDYFANINNPIKRLKELLKWCNQPVNTVVEQHHKVLKQWEIFIKKGVISSPRYILHVDEHHDMMDEKRTLNIANFLYHVMSKWSDCCVFWLVDEPIDSPEIWLSEDVWDSFARRFSVGSECPQDWPKPDLVSVCTSQEFIDKTLMCQLLRQIEIWNNRLQFSKEKLTI